MGAFPSLSWSIITTIGVFEIPSTSTATTETRPCHTAPTTWIRDIRIEDGWYCVCIGSRWLCVIVINHHRFLLIVVRRGRGS